MRRPTHTSRFIAMVSLLAMLGSLLVTAPAVIGASPNHGRAATLSRTGQGRNVHRLDHLVNVSRLPQGSGKPSASRPLAGPTPSSTSRAPLVAPAPPVEATTSATPPADEPVAYDGLSSTTAEPPDSGVAAGPDHVVQVAASGVRITDRGGTEVASVTLKQFFATPDDSEAFDNPRIVWDSLHGRWVVTQSRFDCNPNANTLVGTGWIDVAYSLTADPTGFWGVVLIDYPGYAPVDVAIGTSTDKLMVSANVEQLATGSGTLGCDTTGFVGSEMDVMSWSEVLGSGDIFLGFLYGGFGPDPSFTNEYSSWRPARQTPATSATLFVVARKSDDSVIYGTITGNPANNGSVFLNYTDLTAGAVVAGFATPPDPQQPGSPATITDATDGRPTDAVWQNNRFVFESTYPCDPNGGATETRDCVRVTELDTSTSTPTLTQDFLIAQDGSDLFMGGAALALNGDLHVVWTRSSGSVNPSSQTALQLSTDTPNTIGARSTLAPGTGTYPGSRWGDYAGIAQDPQVPNAVWQANEFSAGANLWATHVSQVQTGGSSYTPITPLRVLDTRPTIHVGLSGVFAANVPRSWQVAGVGTIPADAIAVTGNVTVTGQTAAGYLAVTPDPTASPPSSTINFPLSDNRANNLTVPLNSAGKLSATYKAAPGRSTNLIFDVTGYFSAGGSATYNTVSPATRVLDSRFGVGLSGKFVTNVPRTLTIGGVGTIPVDAVAITANLTVVNQTRAGYLAVTFAPTASPATSNLNFPLGDTRANGLSAPLNAGKLSIVYKASSGTTDVILDVTGYYRNDPGGLLFYPLSPGRIMDTRPGVVLSGLTGAFSGNTPRVLTTADHWGVPAGAAALSGNFTVVGQTAAGYAAITVLPTVTPPTSTINFPLGDTRANGVTVPIRAGTDIAIVYKAAASKTTHFILDVTGYFK